MEFLKSVLIVLGCAFLILVTACLIVAVLAELIERLREALRKARP